MNILVLILSLFLIAPELMAEQYQIKGSAGYRSGGINRHSPPRPVHQIVKPRPPYWARDPGDWYGYPRVTSGFYYGGGGSHTKETIIIKETVKEQQPIIIQVPAPEPEKEWVPPIYENKTIPGHFTSAITETVDGDGVKTFANNGEQVWVPESNQNSLVSPGYWRSK